MTKTRAGLYLMALCVVTLWGASFPLTKAALEEVGPSAIAFLRWAISALVLIAWLAWRARNGTHEGLGAAGVILRTEWRTVAWLALTGIALYYFLQNLALRYTTATNAGVLSNLVSVFMVLIATWRLRERLSTVEWLAMSGAFAGSVLVSQGAGHLRLGGPGCSAMR
jgi:drug/metabolite transporter (DMT)-like permease